MAEVIAISIALDKSEYNQVAFRFGKYGVANVGQCCSFVENINTAQELEIRNQYAERH